MKLSYKQMYRRTFNGKIRLTYQKMKGRVKGNNETRERTKKLYVGKSICSKEDFIKWSKTDPCFLKLFKRWKKSGFKLINSPSIDRIDSSKGYKLNNIRWISNSENCYLGAKNHHTSK